MAATVSTAPPALLAFQARYPEVAAGVAGGEWTYRDTARDGMPLVLLPGAQATADMFYRVAAALADDLRVITATPPPLADCGALARSLAGFLDAVGASRAHLLGSSLSGHVVQLFAAMQPQRVETLVLSSTFFDAAPYLAQMPSAEAIAATPAEQLLDSMLMKMLAAPVTEPVQLELQQAVQALMGPRQSAATLRTRVLALRLSGVAPVVPLAPERIVLIDDDDDPVILPGMRRQLRERYRASEQHTLAGGGHYPYILRADAYAEILRMRLQR
jgi:maspardin